ncbi:MAG: PQQ-like beta-propeller repeat protein, partial [Phycisphaerae bacterium]|nr:PQQ-like beta-propeller repeat protein [Phycisphaerae bacterium]
MTPFLRHRLFGFLLLAMAASVALADDWPQWRGPQRDGVWRETGLIQRFSADRIPHLWKVPLGSGYTGPSVAAGRVYVTDYLDEPAQRERVHCFDANTGRKIWSHVYDCDYSTISYKAGPRASVLVEKNRAYSLGAVGHLFCLNAADGSVIWNRDLARSYGIRMPRWGIAAAPLVEGNLLILHIGGKDGACIVALDKRTGQEQWRALDDMASYSAPIVIDQAGQRVLVCYVADRVVGLAAASGKLLWSYGMPGSKWPIAISTPVLHGDQLFVTSAHVGAALLRLRQDRPAVEPVWRRDGSRDRSPDTIHALIPTPLLIDQHIYGIHAQGELRCLELATGKQVWEDQSVGPVTRFATVHLVPNGDRVWMFNEKGELIISRLSPQGFREISRAKLIDPTPKQFSRREGVTWSHPAFAGRRVYIRNDRE